VTKEHLIRADIPNKTACGISAHFKWITISPKGVTCQRCVRCMTPKEIGRFLGRGPLTGVPERKRSGATGRGTYRSLGRIGY